jgi:nitrilase
MRTAIIAALQIGSQPDGTAATLDRILSHASAIRNAGAQLVVMPEALLGGYRRARISAHASAIARRRDATRS